MKTCRLRRRGPYAAAGGEDGQESSAGDPKKVQSRLGVAKGLDRW